MLGDAALSGELAADHLRTLDVHDLRIGGRAARDLEKSLRIESKSLGKYQTLGHGQSVEAQDQIDGELGAPAISDLADMEMGRKQRAQDRLYGGCDLRIAADQRDTLAAADLAARAGDRGFQEVQPARRNTLAQCGDAVRVAGACTQDDFAGAVAQRGQEFAFDDRFDLIGAEHREHDGIAMPREIGDGRSRPAAQLAKLGVLGRIEADDLEAGVGQAMRECLAQQPDADEAHRVTVAHELHPSPTPANRTTFPTIEPRTSSSALAGDHSERSLSSIKRAARCRDRARPSRDSRAAAWAWGSRSGRGPAA